jgi:hypothetical protein
VNILYDRSIAIIVVGTHFGKESILLLDKSNAVSDVSLVINVSAASAFRFLNRNEA